MIYLKRQKHYVYYKQSKQLYTHTVRDKKISISGKGSRCGCKMDIELDFGRDIICRMRGLKFKY